MLVDGIPNYHGMIFKITPTGQFHVVYAFDGVHGSIPSSLVRLNNGYLIGTTTWGGIDSHQYHGGGVIFKLAPNGTLSVLHTFDSSNPSGGYWPFGPLAFATDGKIYGTTLVGGSGSGGEDGIIWRITPNGTFEIVHNFFKPEGRHPNGIVQHTNGVLYGQTESGGTYDGDGVMFSFEAGLKPFVALESTFGAPGTRVGIIGSGFTSIRAITFNGVAAQFRVISGTYATATVPANATTGYVKVVTANRTLKSNRIFRVKSQ
jgi:uncharacterized repeat protein (TIGR03803 family)